MPVAVLGVDNAESCPFLLEADDSPHPDAAYVLVKGLKECYPESGKQVVSVLSNMYGGRLCRRVAIETLREHLQGADPFWMAVYMAFLREPHPPAHPAAQFAHCMTT